MSTDISVASILSNSVAQCASTDSLAHAARLMKDSQGTSVIVMEKGKPVGIWTERDSLNLDFSKPKTFEMPIGELMRSPVKTINSRISVSEAGIRFKKEGTHHFLVVDDSEKVIGIITQTEVIQNHGVEHFFTMPDTRAALSGPLVKIPGKATINQVVKALRDSNSDAVIVEGNKDEEYGIITERDLIRLVAEQKKYHSVNEVANRPVITIPHDSSILIARDMLKEKKIRHLGVTDDDGNLIGLLTYSDILKCIQYEYVHRMDEYLKAQGLAEGGKEKTVNLAQKVLDVSADGIMIVNKEGIIEAVNPAFTTITGYARDEAVGMNPRFLKSGRHDDSFFKSMWESLLNKGFWQGEIWNRRKNGEVYLEWLTINVIYDEKGEIQRYSGIFSDISERKKTEEHIRKLAYFDILTGLPNRRLFMDRVSMAIANAGRSGQHLGIMFVDLDLFKRINDTFGHIVGDGVLKEMSVRLSKSLREGDTICRLGGDEFTVLLPKVDEVDDIVKAARRAINDIKNPFIVDGHELYVTASIGIAIFPEDGLAVEELIKNADEAM
ncbi:MAG: diguanylate cyclase, partial [Rhodospirillales bacterium]|nr:diguanylate cyclase [Rhodospirillales bacterium]